MIFSNCKIKYKNNNIFNYANPAWAPAIRQLNLLDNNYRIDL